jgi:hypothetical protein
MRFAKAGDLKRLYVLPAEQETLAIESPEKRKRPQYWGLLLGQLALNGLMVTQRLAGFALALGLVLPSGVGLALRARGFSSDMSKKISSKKS